jgi:hypothetical protein
VRVPRPLAYESQGRGVADGDVCRWKMIAVVGLGCILDWALLCQRMMDRYDSIVVDVLVDFLSCTST